MSCHAEARGMQHAEARRLELDEITGVSIDSAVRIHRRLGPGLLESLYECLLACELRRSRLRAERPHLISRPSDGSAIEAACRAARRVAQCVITEVTSLAPLCPFPRK